MPTDRNNPVYEQIEGRNPVLEALLGERKVYEVYLARGIERKGVVAQIISECDRQGIPMRELPRERFNEMTETSAPQGVVARVSPYRYAELEDILDTAGKNPALVFALDGVEDPHNLGTLLRVADAVTADGVIVAKRRSAQVTATVAKASAGAVEHVRLARVANLERALARLKEEGLWVVGAEGKGGVPYWELDLTGPLALVLGGEGKGLSRLVRKRCDFLAGLPMLGEVSSLNVATAAAVLAYEAVRQRAGSR
jgi:23S rRNA (guanosine2251-2'-O)-methyltransferase